jgi:hypothetical protein
MKTKTKILKVFAIVAIFLGNSHLMAQTVTTTDIIAQTVCVNSLQEPYEVIPVATSTYAWSLVDQATGLPPAVGVADITASATDWLIYIDWTTAGIYELSVEETDATTCAGNSVVLTITVEDNANTPVVVTNAIAICLNDANPTMTASTGGGTGSGVFNWYAEDPVTPGTPGALLAPGSATYTQPLPNYTVGVYNYFVREESANGCEGPFTMVTVTVTPLPTAPTLANIPYKACVGDDPLTYPLMTAVGAGSNFNWYEDNLVTPGTPGTQVATNSNTYTSTEVIQGTYTYYVEEVVGSCTSPQTTFTFTINILPGAPSITPDPIEICEGDVPGDFTANTGGAAGTFIWYSDAALTNVITGAAATCTPNQLLPGVYTYYLTETDLTTACISPSSQATFIINELPLQPTVSANPSAIICDGQTNPTFTAAQGIGSTGTGDFYWYDVDPLANPSAVALNPTASNTFTPSVTAVSPIPYQYWVREFNVTTGCPGPAYMFTFEIVALPAAPTLIPNTVEICFGDANPAITPTGVTSSGANLIWYDDVALTSQVGTGATYIPGTNQIPPPPFTVGSISYWVVDQPGTCVSPALQVDLQINPLPTPGPIWHN